MNEHWAKRVSVFSAAFIVAAGLFSYGLLVGRLQIWPYGAIHTTVSVVANLAAFGGLLPIGRRVNAPANASREVMTIHDSKRLAKGYYVFVGWDDTADVYSAWLYDARGEQRHRWPIDYKILDTDGPLNGAENPHPFSVLEDGSIIVGFDKGDVMARLDSCGAPLWIKQGIYHHAMSRAEDGSFWVWRGDGGTAYGHFNYLENFDAETGESVREIALTEDLIERGPSAALLFGVRPDYPFRKFPKDPENSAAADLFHPNDVEVLSSELAPRFPLFEAGDLLLSFRNLNLIAVADPYTYELKWWSHGPWINQHDPDFMDDGRISVYNNGREQSSILTIDPVTRVVSNDLSEGNLTFYSETMGKHQYLPNGNVLIVIPGEGRILEVTERGDVVLEFNNVSPVSAKFNEHVENAIWIPDSFFDSLPSCPQQSQE